MLYKLKLNLYYNAIIREGAVPGDWGLGFPAQKFF